jgi:uncharacterized protein YhfF
VLGNEISNYNNWTHLRAEAGYSIWSYPVSDFADGSCNLMFIDNVAMDYRGEADSLSVETFLKVINVFEGTDFDQTTEAGTEGGTAFSFLQSNDGATSWMYMGASSQFKAVDFDLETVGGNYDLRMKYWNGSEWAIWDGTCTTASFVDNTYDLRYNGRIEFDLPSDWVLNQVDGTTGYWVRMYTNDVPLQIAQAYHVLPGNSVPTLLSLSEKQVSDEDYSWCYYDSNVYATLPNEGDSHYEGDLFIKSSTSTENKQAYFISNHIIKISHLRATYAFGAFSPANWGLTIWTDATRPTEADQGRIGWNSDTDRLEIFDGVCWDQIANLDDIQAMNEFTELTDTPSTYIGSCYYLVAVNATGTGLTFVPNPEYMNQFLELTDVPSSYTGSSEYMVRVNNSEDGLEFVEGYTKTQIDNLLDIQNEFTELTDTPASYSGEADKVATVNSAEDGISFLVIPQFDAMKEPTGFPNRTDSEISFADGNRRLTIQPTSTSFDYWIKGTKYTKTSAQTVDLTDATNLYYIYFDGATLTQGTSFWDFAEVAPVAIVYWDSDGASSAHIVFEDERHGCVMSADTHTFLHSTVGTRYQSGLTSARVASGSGGADGDAQISLTDGIIWDEDLVTTIEDGSSQELTPIAQIPIIYRSGAGSANWKKDVATNFPVKQGAARITYNLDTGGTWSTPDATNNYHVAMWIFATNDVDNPVVAFLGQRQDLLLVNAQNNNTYESLSFGTLPFAEMKVLYRLIFKTSNAYGNTPHAYVADTEDLRSVSNLPAGTYVATAHSSLTGLSDANSHPASAIVNTPSGTISATNVQDAIDELAIESDEFTELTDTPSSYSGEGDKMVVVNTAEDALCFVQRPDIVDEFTDLTDTPSSYSGEGNKVVVVNGQEDGLCFIQHTLTDLSDTPPSYTGEAGKVVTVNAQEDGVSFLAAGGAGKAVIWLMPGSAKLPNSGFARLEKVTRAGSNPDCVDNVIKFNADGDDSDEYAYWQSAIPGFYQGGNLTVTVYSTSNDTDSGAPTADLHFDAMMINDDEPWDTTFTAIGTNAIGMGSAAYDLMRDTIAWTSNLPTAGDMVKFRVWVDESDSDLAVDLEVLAIKIEED